MGTMSRSGGMAIHASVKRKPNPRPRQRSLENEEPGGLASTTESTTVIDTTIAELRKYVGISAPTQARRNASKVNVVGRPSLEFCQSASVRSALLTMK